MSAPGNSSSSSSSPNSPNSPNSPSSLLTKIVAVHAEAQQLLIEHGLAEQGWTFEIHNKKNAVGTCNYNDRKIQFSKYFLDSPEATVTDVLLHEIAHALVGPGNGHNYVWKAKAREIGADPYSRAAHGSTVNSAIATANYTLVCNKCGASTYRHRLKLDPDHIIHSKQPNGARCGGKMSVYRNVEGRQYVLSSH